MSKSAMYSLIATGITFLGLLIFYTVKKPSFVMEDDTSGKKVLSIRLSIIYSLLFASTMGLVVLGISSIVLKNTSSSKNSLVEMPTMTTSFKFGANKKNYSCCGM